MICLLVTMILISGIENTEQRNGHSDTILRQEELDDDTKGWLLMVESGKVDEEQLRKITPKSVFIAPLLSNRKCKEGYRHDHLGNCVKVIKVDPNAQLELLLKQLSTMYAENKREEEDRLPVMSSGPLHFSIPILNPDTTPKEEIGNNSTSKDVPETIPVPLPMSSNNTTNQTAEFESSGFGPVNRTENFEGSGYEGSGFESGDLKLEDTTTTVGIISEELDYTEVTEATTTEMPPVDVTTQVESQSYQSEVFDVSNTTGSNSSSDLTLEQSENPENETEPDSIRFPSDEVRTQTAQVDYVRFPEENSNAGSNRPTQNWNSNFHFGQSALSRNQFWWLPENWKIDESQHKPTLVKFWSRLPLIHDTSYVQDATEVYRKQFTPSRPHSDFFRPSTRLPPDYDIGLNPPLPISPRRKFHTNERLFVDRIAPRNSFNVHR